MKVLGSLRVLGRYRSVNSSEVLEVLWCKDARVARKFGIGEKPLNE